MVGTVVLAILTSQPYIYRYDYDYIFNNTQKYPSRFLYYVTKTFLNCPLYGHLQKYYYDYAKIYNIFGLYTWDFRHYKYLYICIFLYMYTYIYSSWFGTVLCTFNSLWFEWFNRCVVCASRIGAGVSLEPHHNRKRFTCILYQKSAE